MRDTLDLLSAFEAATSRGERAVLASVVQVEGSTYRRPGARALFDARDRAVGLVSGGCLEGDLAIRARSVRDSGRPTRARYDSRDDADLLFGLGLGCRGVVDVLLERVDAEDAGPLPYLARQLARRRPAVLVSELDDESLRRWWLPVEAVADDRALEGAALSGPLREAVLALARRSSAQESAAHAVSPTGAPLFAEWLPVRTRLLLIGAGPDALPLVELASRLGWQVEVWDARPAFADPSRLPLADAVRKRSPDAGDPDGFVDEYTAVVVMTHHLERDRSALSWLLESPARYVGALGPRARSDEMLRALGLPGGVADAPERLHAPAGLDLGAESSAEIALAIVSEIQAVFARHPGGPLRARKGPIHERPA